MTTICKIVGSIPAFSQKLTRTREAIDGVNWYPYDSFGAASLLATFIPDNIEIVPEGGFVIDIGAGDGDVGFLLHDLGARVDFLDNPSTNYNRCQGIIETAKAMRCDGLLIQRDIDQGLELDRQYDLAIFLGALYHLRNPAAALMQIAQHCRTMVLSTRVMSHLPNGAFIADQPITYLLDKHETNGDATNWWIFSPEGLRRLLKRCGWNVIASASFGAIGDSNPVDPNCDERAFFYCERVENYRDLLVHHDF